MKATPEVVDEMYEILEKHFPDPGDESHRILRSGDPQRCQCVEDLVRLWRRTTAAKSGGSDE